jgi:hypothetical protein
VGPEHKASEDLAKMATWAEDSLGYARGHGQRELARLLGAVRADVEFGRALLAVPTGEHLGPARGEAARNDERRTGKADDVRKQEREEQKHRARLAAWELFKDGERRELELRKGGQLGRLLGEALPGESPAALRRLAGEDQRQAEVGLVALMSTGKVHYKLLDELSPNDMPARAAANRSRTTWLKERRDG